MRRIRWSYFVVCLHTTTRLLDALNAWEPGGFSFFSKLWIYIPHGRASYRNPPRACHITVALETGLAAVFADLNPYEIAASRRSAAGFRLGLEIKNKYGFVLFWRARVSHSRDNVREHSFAILQQNFVDLNIYIATGDIRCASYLDEVPLSRFSSSWIRFIHAHRGRSLPPIRYAASVWLRTPHSVVYPATTISNFFSRSRHLALAPRLLVIHIHTFF